MQSADPNPELIFVYGTLLPEVPGSRHHLLTPATFIVRGSCPGTLYSLGSYPGAVPGGRPGSRIRGSLFRLGNPQEAIRRMDRYEGFIADQPIGCEFRRESVLVTPDDGSGAVSAWIYYYNLSTDGLPVIRDGDFARSVCSPSA